MANKEFLHQRICIFAGKEIDPNSDRQIEDMLRNKFNIHLPQRTDPLHQYRTPKKLSKLTPEVIHEQETIPADEQKIYSRV